MNFILHPDLFGIIKAVGYAGIFFIIFAESGILIGFFLPGDTLLFSAGLLAAAGYLNLPILIIVIALGAVLGDQFGYFLGRKYGPKIWKHEESFWFKKKRVEEAEAFFKKYGKKTILLARFVPVVRTFAPVLAGVGKMDYGTFFKYNVWGGILWSVSVTMLGYFLGEAVPNIDMYLLPIVILIAVLSVLPGAVSYLRNKKKGI